MAFPSPASKILYITDQSGAAKAGYGLRITNTLAGLGLVGEVTTVFLCRAGEEDSWPEAASTITTSIERTPVGRLRALLAREPAEARYANQAEAVAGLAHVLRSPFDLIWVMRPRPVNPLLSARVGSPNADTPLIVDFDDVYELQKAYQAKHYQHPNKPWLTRPMRYGFGVQRWLWAEYQRKVAAAATLTLVTSEEDRRHLGFERLEVLPNGYPAVAPRANSATESITADPDRCEIAFVGGLHYPPNADAARLLAEEILPLVRKRMPGAQLRIAGRPGPPAERLGRLPGVTYHGLVDDLDAFLAPATVIATPIQSGVGSRLKVIEAMARRIPLVSTTFGVRGFAVEDGEHLLVAETSQEMAAAIESIHTTPGLASRLVENAYQRFVERYETTVVAARTAELALKALAQPD